MGSRLGTYNWPPVQVSWGEKMSARQDVFITYPLFAFPEAETKDSRTSYLALNSCLYFEIYACA